MAVVFRAHDDVLGRTVALKVLAPALADDRQFRERFIRESRAVAAVDHPHIIPVYAAGEADGVLYLAMRFVSGGDLRAVLTREGALTGDRAIALLSPVASALDVAHADGLVHRDVKPANILVDARAGRSEHPYLSDFGLVKGAMVSGGLTQAGQFLGTANYVAPEQIAGQPARPQTDQYSLACVAYTLLSGTVPFARDDSMAVLWAHMYDPPPSLVAQRPGQPSAVDGVFARALAKSPEDRYGTCAEFIGALRTAFSTSQQAAPAASTGPLPAVTAPQPRQGPAIPSPAEPVSDAREQVPPTALTLHPAEASASAPPATHVQTVIGLPPSHESSVVEEPAGDAEADEGRVPAEGTDPPVPPAPRPQPDDDSAAMTETMSIPTMAGKARDSTQPVTDGPVSSRAAADTVPPARRPPAQPARKARRRHRALIVATTATVAVLAGGGALLGVHPWIHPPVLKPTGLTLASDTADVSGTAVSVEITWSGPVTGPLPDDYEIFRDGTQIGTVLGTATSYTDDGLTPNTSYAFQVIAVRGGKQSPASVTMTAQTPPLQPTGLGVRHETTSSLEIAWSGPATGPAPGGYEILRNGSERATVPGSVTSYTDKGLAPDTEYSYQVIAITGSKQSQASAALTSARTSKPPLSAAVLSWDGLVREKMISINPAEKSYPIQPGSSTQDNWTIAPDCSSGACDATLTGAYDGHDITTKLTRSGTHYSGTAELADVYSCGGNKNELYSGTLNINITVNSADTRAGVWTATSFYGQETVNIPVAYTCYAATAQLDVKSS